jgi:cytochrome b pre-mRNA-processing protein 3
MSGLGRLSKAWPFRKSPERLAAEQLLAAVIAASRAPALYGAERISDTMDSRFESAILHASLALIRLQKEDAARPQARILAQEFVDRLFRWLDSGLYEAGVGYQQVPKRIRAMAARFYARLEVYAAAIEAGDSPALAGALARNIPCGEAFAETLAIHVLRLSGVQAAAAFTELSSAALWPPLA